jgi:hypothetical protein
MSILTALPQLSPSLSTTTQKIVVTNNYDMPILTEFLQLSPSQSPKLKSIKTSKSTTNNVISIPNTDDNTIDEEIISKNQLLTDSIETSLLTPTHLITVSSSLSKSSLKKKKKLTLDSGRVVVESSVSHSTTPLCSKRNSKKMVVIEQSRKSQSNLSLFTDVWSEKNTQALRANWNKAFGEDLLMNWSKGGGSVIVLPPLKHLLLDDVPHPPQRRQPRQLPHHYRQRQIEIPLHSCDETIIQY